GHLDLEVWLLYNMKPVQTLGADRASAITLGTHGIQIARGDRQGLFLPSVATENRWDVQRFLDQVCIKAGLYPTAWQDEATALFTFEGQVVRGKIDGGASQRRGAVCESAHVPAYADLCRNNIQALLSGTTPNYFFFGVPDG